MEITIKNLNKTYGNKKAINNLSATFKVGMNGLLGPNGAGKSTLMKILSTILEKDNGDVSVIGKGLNEKSSIREMLGYLPQNFNCYPKMSVFENLDYLAFLSGFHNKKEREEAVLKTLKKVNLDNDKNKKVKGLSGGMLRRLGIAQAIINDPKVLIVDEPTAGLSPEERVRFRNIIESLSEDKIIILSTHIVSDIEDSCEHLLVIDEGKAIFEGGMDEFVQKSKGYIFSGEIDRKEITTYEDKYTVVTKRKVGAKMLIKIIAEEKPNDDFVEVDPSLEDTYMFTIHSNIKGKE